VNVTAKLLYQVKWVDFDNQLPATPVQLRPSVSTPTRSTTSGNSYVPPSNGTPSASCANDIFCNAISYVGTAPNGTSRSWIDDALVGSALNGASKAAIRRTWGNDEVPNSAAAWTDEISCSNYAYPQSTAYTSIDAC
jgi:hypothetical protein